MSLSLLGKLTSEIVLCANAQTQIYIQIDAITGMYAHLST